MALTLAEAAKLSNDLVVRGIMEEIVYESPMMQMLPWIEKNGHMLWSPFVGVETPKKEKHHEIPSPGRALRNAAACW